MTGRGGQTVLIGMAAPGRVRRRSTRSLSRSRSAWCAAAGTARAVPPSTSPSSIDLYRAGRIRLGAMTEPIRLQDINAAFDRLRAGRRGPLGRPVLGARDDHVERPAVAPPRHDVARLRDHVRASGVAREVGGVRRHERARVAHEPVVRHPAARSRGRRAPHRRGARNRARRAVRRGSTSPPRATLTRNAPGRIRASRRRVDQMMRRVRERHVQAHHVGGLPAARRARSARRSRARPPRRRAGRGRRPARTRPAPGRPTRRPMRPRPSTPSVAPLGRRSGSAAASQRPSRTARSRNGMPRSRLRPIADGVHRDLLGRRAGDVRDPDPTRARRVDVDGVVPDRHRRHDSQLRQRGHQRRGDGHEAAGQQRCGLGGGARHQRGIVRRQHADREARLLQQRHAGSGVHVHDVAVDGERRRHPRQASSR